MEIQSILKPTHQVSVIVFLLIYSVKTVLLLANSHKALESFKRVTKVPEMLVSTLFLVTGIWMFVAIGSISTLQIVKLVMVVAAIPLAVVAYKKNKKPLAIVSLLLIIAAYGMAEMNKAKKRKEAGTSTVATTTDVVTDPTAAGYNSIKHGEYIYNNLAPVSCKSCHGDKGNAMIGNATDLTQSGLDKESIKNVIKNGRVGAGQMPAFGSLQPAEYDALADYLTSLRK